MTGLEDPEAPYGAVEHELGLLLRRAQSYSREIARQDHPDLDGAEYSLLACLDRTGGRAAELAGYFGIDRSAVSRQVRALERLGLIVREADPRDGRAQRLVVTGEGRRRLREVRRLRRRRLRALLASWGAEEVARFAEQLRRFNDLHVFRDRPPADEGTP